MDFPLNQIVVRAGKGDKDRYTMLPTFARDLLQRHLEAVQRQHQEDLRLGLGRVLLPGALDQPRRPLPPPDPTHPSPES